MDTIHKSGSIGKKSVILLFLLLSISNIHLLKGQGYQIAVTVIGLENQKVYFGYNYGENRYLKDTIQLDEKGSGTFQAAEILQEGMYFVAFPTNQYFELIIDQDQQFLCSTYYSQYVDSMQIEGSVINHTFYEYQRVSQRIRGKISEIQKQSQAPGISSSARDMLSLQISMHEKSLFEQRDKYIVKYSGTLFSNMLKAITPVYAPPSPLNEKGEIIDSSFQYYFYKEHFFDNIDFSDTRLLRTGLIHNKLNVYLRQILPPDYNQNITAIAHLERILKGNDEMYRYVMFYLLRHYEKDWGTATDEIFIYLAENYFLPFPQFWNNPALIKKISDRVDEIRPTLIGQPSTDLKMESMDGEYISLHQLTSRYKVLVFWDTECEHCQEVLPQLVSLSTNYSKSDFTYFSVYVGKDKEKWQEVVSDLNMDWVNVWDPDYLTSYRDFYDIYRTPEIFIIDKNNRIVARRLEIESIKNILNLLLQSNK